MTGSCATSTPMATAAAMRAGATTNTSLSATTTCDAPSLAIANDADDCDDTNAMVHNSTIWFKDNDGDGFGDDDDILANQCERHPVANGQAVYISGDCDDSNQALTPLATEIAGSQDDEDCDALYDCFTDADGDGFGSDLVGSNITQIPVGGIGCGGYGTSSIDTDCDDSNAMYNPDQDVPRHR